MTNNNKRWFLFLCTLLLCVLTAALISQREQTASRYILGEYDGRVAAFRIGSGTPIQITDTAVASLPEEEAQMLRKGIPAATEEDLQRLIEDYCS